MELNSEEDAIRAELKAIRHAVGDVMLLFKFTEEPNVKTNARVLARMDPNIRYRLIKITSRLPFEDSRDRQAWREQVGIILAMLRRCCPLCKPLVGEHRDACVHAEELERVAALKCGLSNWRAVADETDAQLGSETNRRKFTREEKRLRADLRSRARSLVALESPELRSIVHRTTYEEAAILFNNACLSRRTDADYRWCMRER